MVQLVYSQLLRLMDRSMVDAATTATILTSGTVQVVKNGTAIVDASGNTVANSVKVN